MNNIFLIEDHDEALRIWREKKIKGLDLVHIDAHIDFGFHPARPIEKVVNAARSLKELKEGLENSIAFIKYEKDFNKQSNIGNYIYPAMEEEIVKNFYWVVPGGLKEFKKSAKPIRNMIKNLMKDTPRLRSGQGRQRKNVRKRISESKDIGIITTKLLDRNFIICTLEKLSVLRQDILLDIDTDFLVINSLLNSGNTERIGERKPWISPGNLAGILKKKIKRPHLITVAYSVNGGWTPMKYKHLGDEIAYHFAPKRFKKHLENQSRAAEYFNLFTSTEKKKYYRKAIKLNPTYRAADNNYGPLYLSSRKLSFAHKEFLKILEADPLNPACLLGLGNIALERRNFKKAKKCFSSILNSGNHRLFIKVRNQGLLGLAKAEFKLKNFAKAKRLLYHYRSFEPLEPQSYYLLGRIFEKERDFKSSAILYKDALRLGFSNIDPISRLLNITPHLKEKKDMIKYITAKYRVFKKGFKNAKKLNIKKGKDIKGFRKIEQEMVILEKRLRKVA